MNFTEDDMENALTGVMEAARKYDKNMPGQPMLDGFESILYMPPHVFKDQLQRAFKIKLSPQETGALLAFFNAVRTNLFLYFLLLIIIDLSMTIIISQYLSPFCHFLGRKG
jgi:hypothetical protein